MIIFSLLTRGPGQVVVLVITHNTQIYSINKRNNYDSLVFTTIVYVCFKIAWYLYILCSLTSTAGGGTE